MHSSYLAMAAGWTNLLSDGCCVDKLLGDGGRAAKLPSNGCFPAKLLRDG